MFQLVLQPDEATKALLNRAFQLIVQMDVRTKQMATAFETLKDEMAQTRAKVDVLAAGIQALRDQLAAGAANGLTPEQVAELVNMADETQAAADAAIGEPTPQDPPEAS